MLSVLIPLLHISKEDLGLGPFCTVEPRFRIFIEKKLPICTQDIVRNTMFYRYITVLQYLNLNFLFVNSLCLEVQVYRVP